jgi:glycosyltransferase involved in cell wall biosynthesis
MMRKDHTLHVGLVGPMPPPYGGMANQTHQLHRLLSREGLQVSLVRTNAPYGAKWIEKLRGVRALFRLLPYLVRLWRLAGQVDVMHVLANSGWSWQLFAAPALWIGWLRSTPVIVNYRGGEARRYFNQSMRWVRPSIRKAAAVVVPSGYLKQVFADFGIEARVIPNIIDLQRFVAAEKDRSLNADSPKLVITRNLEAIYGIATAIEALALLRRTVPGITLTIAGSGPEKAALQQLVAAENLGRNVVFTGKLAPDEIARLYRQADIMLNPTTVDNMPNSVLEAMACGVAVVTTSVGGIPYIVEHDRTALFAEAGNAGSMAEQIRRLLNEPGLYQALIENGQREVRQYAWPEVKNLWLDLYQSSRRSGWIFIRG